MYTEDNHDVLVERDGYRAVLELDQTPEPPYNDGGVPSFLVHPDHGRNYIGTGVNESHLPLSKERLWELYYDIFDSNEGLWSRYLRIFHDTPFAVVGGWNGYSQSDWGHEVKVATRAWIESMGWGTVEQGLEQLNKEEGDSSELVSWAKGDVYGIIVQRDVSEDGDDEPDWEDTDEACWGFYGDSNTAYFKEEAERMMAGQKDWDEAQAAKLAEGGTYHI